MFKIFKVRTIAVIYPHTSFEAIVNIDDHMYFFNFDVKNGQIKIVDNDDDLIDDGWAYTVPLDAVYFAQDNTDYNFIKNKDYLSIFKEMAEIWNSNPVWDRYSKWYFPKSWQERS